jgi:hypothetical protein
MRTLADLGGATMRVMHAIGIQAQTGMVLTDDVCAWPKPSPERGRPG